MTFRILLCLILFSCQSVRANANADIFDSGQRYFQTVGNEASIPLGIVTALAQDKQGFIWIGTQKGLVRYDGYRFKLFQYDKNDPQSLGGDFVNKLWAAEDGRLWVGTRHNGLSVYNPESASFLRYPFGDDGANRLSDGYITSIVGDNVNTVWVGTKRGLNKLSLANGQITQYLQNAESSHTIHNHRIGSLLLDDEKRLWVGTADGLSLYDHATSHFTLQHSSQEDKSSLAGLLVNELYQAKDGKIWVATNNGAAWLTVAGAYKRIESDGSKSDKLSHVSIVNIAQPHDNEVWLATYGGGINVLDAASGTVISQIKHDISVPSGINHDAFGALLLDRSGLLWLGTWGNGLNYYNTSNAAFSTLRHSPSNDNSLRYPDVLSVMEIDNGDIWVGARSR